MLFTAVPPITAPQTTGHPAALPQDAARVAPETRVSAPKGGGASDNTRSDSHLRREFPGRRPKDGDQKSAPPTLLQIKINSMLAEQQEARAQERRDADAPEAVPAPAVDAEPADLPKMKRDAATQPVDRPVATAPQSGYYAAPEPPQSDGQEVSLSA